MFCNVTITMYLGLSVYGVLLTEVDAFAGPLEREDKDVEVFVEQQSDCMRSSDIRRVLYSVLAPRAESRYMAVTVVVAPAVGGYVATLRVVTRDTGEILLERRLSLSADDCRDAHLVLKVMLEQFLTSFPIEEWRDRLKKEPEGQRVREVEIQKVLVEKETSTLHWLLLVGLDSRWPTPSGSIELTGGLDVGSSRHGFIGNAVVREGYPRPLEGGRYLDTTAMLGLGWRFSPKPSLMMRTEVRTGALLVNGVGYPQNHHRWMLWLEIQLSLVWRLGSFLIGPEVAASPLTHSVSTTSNVSEDLPWIRVGLVFGGDLFRVDLE
jgi:hypothetical protein